ncbi:MAG: hypothetical protein WBW74_11660 [Xanthobacteraceae bacterium]
MKALVIAAFVLGAFAMPAHAQEQKFLNINGNLFDTSAGPSFEAPKAAPKAKAVRHVKRRTQHKGSPT